MTALVRLALQVQPVQVASRILEIWAVSLISLKVFSVAFLGASVVVLLEEAPSEVTICDWI